MFLCESELETQDWEAVPKVFNERRTNLSARYTFVTEFKQPLWLRRADKTSIKNQRLRNGDCFAIIAFCSHSLLLTNCTTGGLVRAPYY